MYRRPEGPKRSLMRFASTQCCTQFDSAGITVIWKCLTTWFALASWSTSTGLALLLSLLSLKSGRLGSARYLDGLWPRYPATPVRTRFGCWCRATSMLFVATHRTNEGEQPVLVNKNETIDNLIHLTLGK